MPSNALLVHVPVDQIEICNGPGPMWLVPVIADLYTRLTVVHATGTVFVEVKFTLRTPASDRRFRRTLRITAFDIGDIRRDDFGDLDRDCSFTARFDGQRVAGRYNLKRRTGELRRSVYVD